MIIRKDQSYDDDALFSTSKSSGLSRCHGKAGFTPPISQKQVTGTHDWLYGNFIV